MWKCVHLNMLSLQTFSLHYSTYIGSMFKITCPSKWLSILPDISEQILLAFLEQSVQEEYILCNRQLTDMPKIKYCLGKCRSPFDEQGLTYVGSLGTTRRSARVQRDFPSQIHTTHMDLSMLIATARPACRIFSSFGVLI